jgi:hypothetical protein
VGINAPKGKALSVKITGRTRLADITAGLPWAQNVLRSHGIDVDSLADRPLDEALSGTGLSVSGIIVEILHAGRPDAESTPRRADLEATLAGLGARLATILLEKGDDQPELFEVGRQFQRLRDRLRAHFPLGGVQEAADVTRKDHSAISALLARLHEACAGCPPVVHSDPDVAALLDGFRDLGLDIERQLQAERTGLSPSRPERADTGVS